MCFVLLQYNAQGERQPVPGSKILGGGGGVSNDDGDGNEDIKKVMGLLSKKKTFHVHHAFLYISLPSLHAYDVKISNVIFFMEDVNKRRRIFLLVRSPRNQLQVNSPKFNIFNELRDQV